MKRGALAKMAEEMFCSLRQAQSTGWPRALWRPLRRGLIVVLERKSETEWRLGLGRMDVHPSAQEVAICQQAFGVPVETRVGLRTQQRQGAGGSVVTFYIAELFWREYAETTEDCADVGGERVAVGAGAARCVLVASGCGTAGQHDLFADD